jgi:hypothetical protein
LNLSSILGRFSEPSTYSSLAALLGVFGLSIPPGVVQSVALVGTGVAGLVGFFLPEAKKAQ